jgi:ABC-2 type transport system permease protein
MASPWIAVARREFIERVRSKWFVIVTLLGPVFMLGMTLLPALVAHQDAKKKTRVGLVVHGDAAFGATIGEGLRAADPLLELEPVPATTGEDALLGRIRARSLDGWLDVPADVLTGGKAVYRGANATNFSAMARLQGGLQQAAIRARAGAMGLPDDRLVELLRPVAFTADHTTGERKGTSGVASFLLGYVVMFVLYMAILLYAINVMRSVIQEKTSRVIEVLVSTLRPSALMAGKIAGVGSVGLVQLTAWAAMAAVIARFRGSLLSAFGVGGGAVALPAVGAGTVLLLLAYFLLGYFLYAAMYAAVGAMCSSEQEAQQAQAPIVMLIVIPILFVQLVANDPRGPAAVILTLIPFSSPVLMPMRFLLGGATPSEVLLSLGLLAATILVITWLAARIYRIGILMYGKRPTLRELARWIHHA